jgi:hypothetical protein
LASECCDSVDVSDVDGENLLLLIIATESWPPRDDLGFDDIGMILVDPPKLREVDIAIG